MGVAKLSYLFMVIEYTVSPKRPCADNVPVGQDISSFRVDDKARSLTVHRQLRVERTRLTESNRDNTFYDLLDGGLPFRGVWLGGAESV